MDFDQVNHEMAVVSLAARAHERERYEAIAALHPDLLALARLLLGQDADARDLVQDTIEAALRDAGALRDPSRLRPWLVTIEARLASRTRRRLRRDVPLDPELLGRASEHGDDVLALRTALAKLPRRLRTAVVLHHMTGLSVAETANAMRVSENTVKSQLKDGLRRLREMLG
jgi:RNA polymerase sigma factor (sigma-70 family)